MGAGSWFHLAARLFDVLLARPLDHAERERVDDWLQSEAESLLFWSQSIPDQRHGLEGANEVARHAPDGIDLIRAALLHDVGKQRAALGVVGRTLAGLAEKLGLQPGRRLTDHLRHDQIGAALLIEADCGGIVVEFARHHHSSRPSSISAGDWRLLTAADRSFLLD